VAETVRDEQGRAVGGLNEVRQADAFGHPYIQGTAAALASALGQALGVKARYDKPGTLQRMSGSLASPVDLAEAYEAGATAVRFVIEGRSGSMVGFRRAPGTAYRCEMTDVDLVEVANRQRVLPEAYLGTDPFGVSSAFSDYALPFIGPPLLPYARLF
jgi:6-phosphofructokinase 1